MCLSKGSCLQTALSFSPCLQPRLHWPEPSFSQPRQMGCNSLWISSTNPLNWQERLPLSGVKDSFLHRGWLCCLHRTTRTCQPAEQEASTGHHQIWASCLVRIQCFKEHVGKTAWSALECSIIFLWRALLRLALKMSQPSQYNVLLFLDGLCGLNSEYLMLPKQGCHQGITAREKAQS